MQGVVSDWGSDLLPILHAHEITRLMDFVVASAVVRLIEAAPRHLPATRSARAGVRAEETVYVGDSYLADVLGSRAAGLHPVLIDRDGAAPAIDAPVIRSLAQLLEVVDNLTHGAPEGFVADH